MVTVSKEVVRWFKSLYSDPPGFDLFSHISGPSEQKLLENRMKAMNNTIHMHRPNGNSPIASKSPSNKFFLYPLGSLQVDMEGKYTTDDKGCDSVIKWYSCNNSQFKYGKCNWIKSRTDYNCWIRGGKDNCLIKARHTSIDKSEDADYVKHYAKNCPIPSDTTIIAWKGDDCTKWGFWLFKEEEADFVYAILYSDMFRAWCKLTACITWSDENGVNGKPNGRGHFSAGMWDTFYFLKDINLRKEEIKNAGRDLSHDVPGARDTLNRFIDSLVLGSSVSGLRQNDRLQILADRFQADFTNLKTEVINLYLS